MTSLNNTSSVIGDLRRALEKCQARLAEKEETIRQMKAAIDADKDLVERQTEAISKLTGLLTRASNCITFFTPSVPKVNELLRDIKEAFGI